jgi:hypothetical protein
MSRRRSPKRQKPRKFELFIKNQFLLAITFELFYELCDGALERSRRVNVQNTGVVGVGRVVGT